MEKRGLDERERGNVWRRKRTVNRRVREVKRRHGREWECKERGGR